MDWRYSSPNSEGKQALIFTFYISVAENAKNPDFFAAVDPFDYTKDPPAPRLGIGYGVGYLKRISWESEYGAMKVGDWIRPCVQEGYGQICSGKLVSPFQI